MTKNENKKKLFALALRLRTKFGEKATAGIMKRLTKGDEKAIDLLSLRGLNEEMRRQANVTRKEEMGFGEDSNSSPLWTDWLYEQALIDRARKMTKRGRKDR